MIIMINGPFGVGKNTAAEILQKRIENTMLFDPEEVGFMLQSIITEDVKHPAEKTDNFQDFVLWRELVVDVAKKLRDTYGRDLIIPMTIHNPKYFKYILESVRELDDEVYHFCLVADKATVEKRLLRRGDEPGSWAFQHTERCLEAFNGECELFSEIVDTEGRSEEDVAEYILSMLEKSK